jgi:uncharacterized BrkB/YihY/UPF0761 family membrane protein
VVAALFFTIGKLLNRFYLGKAAVGSPYGAACSPVAGDHREIHRGDI